MKIYFFYILVILLSIISCNNEQLNETEPYKKLREFKDNDFVKNKLFAQEQYNVLQSVNDLLIKDSLLVVLTGNKNKPILILNSENLNKIAIGGCYGRGPGEQLAFYSFSDIKGTDYFWVSDIVTKKFTCYNIDSLLKDSLYVPQNQIDFNKYSLNIYAPVIVGNKIVGASFDGKSRLLFCDLKGRLIYTGGIFPKKRDRKVPDQVNSNVYYGMFDAKKNHNNAALLVKVNMFSPIIEFYDITGNELITLLGPDKFSPKYTVENAGGGYMAFAPAQDITIGNMDVVITDKFVYTLYSGKQESYENPATQCNIIYRFTWDGSCNAKYVLNKSISNFYVNNDDSFLYGATLNGVIYKFKIINN